MSYGQIYSVLRPGELLEKPYPERYREWMERASPDRFKVSMQPATTSW